MKSPVLTLMLTCFINSHLWSAPLTIDIKNPGFEEQKTTLNGDGDGTPIGSDPGDYTAGVVPQWTAASAGLFNPNAPVTFAPEGNLVVYMDNNSSLKQPLVFPGGAPVTAVPGASITFTAKARGRTGGTPNTSLNLLVGAVSVSNTVSLSVPANATGYSDVSATIKVSDATTLGANLNQPVTLNITNSGEQLNFDSVAATIIYPPSISNVTATPSPATVGQPVTISWNVSNATSLTFNGTDVTGTTSTAITAPAVATSYPLVATNPDGTTTVLVRIEVTPAALPTPTVRLNEVMTNNTTSLLDENNTPQDWIELHNSGTASVDITGWHLTDNKSQPLKWTFPATTIPAGGYLVVFASGKNRATVPLHTNFSLDSNGEYLALTDTLGNVVSAFAPVPALESNQTYGYGVGPTRDLQTLAGATSTIKWTVPIGPVSDDWRGGAAFNDSAWSSGQWPIGYASLIQAHTIAAATVGGQTYAGSLGMDFDVLRPIEVTDLMCFDSGSNGLSRTITTVLWSRNQNGTPGSTADDTQGTVLASMVFDAATPGTLIGGQRFKPLAAPITLPAGSYTICAYNYGAGEPNGNSAAFNSGTNTGGGAIQFVGTSRYGVTAPPASVAASWPGSPDGGPAARYGSGSFRFREPAAFATNTESAMSNVNASVLTRTSFNVASGLLPVCPILTVRYDDGFVAWLNGVEVARRNAPGSPTYNSTATSTGFATENFSLPTTPGTFRSGENILAIQGLNAAANDADFQLQASLGAETTGQIVGVLSSPTPSANNAAGQFTNHPVINEIHSDPVDSKSQFTEFVEIFNPSSAPVDVSGWRLTGGLEYIIPASTSIPACGYLVIAENPTHLQTYLNYSGSLGPWVGGLKNSGDTVQLRNAALSIVDEVTYELGFPWPSVGDDPGNSMQRIHEGLDSNLGASWRSALPTPGQRNSVTTSLAPPAIRQVNHTPAAPVSNQAVTITAKVTDPQGVATVWLEYQIVEPGNYIRLTDEAWASNWTTVPMTDDGQNGDTVARDDIFTTVLPGSVQQHRRLIRYRLRAWDGALTAVRVPYADDDSGNFAYFVYDGVPAWTGAVQPGITAADTFSTGTMSKVRPWHLLSNPSDVQNCQYGPAYNDGSYRFEGALVIDGKVYDHVHYRIKGQNSTFNTGKNKWKFQFNRGHYLEMPDDYGLKHTTVKTLNISSVPAPWAPWNRGMSGLDEAVAFKLYNLAGAPAPNTSYLQLRVIDGALETNPSNQFDGDLWGLYLAFENTDNNFKDEHGLSDGNIFRMQTGNNHVLGQGKGQPGDLSDLNSFLSTTTGYRLGAATSTTAPAVGAIQNETWFRTNVDLPEYFNWRAVTEAVNQTDRREQENVVYYRSAIDNKWQVFPWDVDLLYEQFDRWGPQATQTAIDYQAYEQISRALIHPAILTEFQNRARELQDLLLNNDQAWKVVDEFISRISNETPRIIPNGGAIDSGFVEVERRRWDYNPLNPIPPRGAVATGNYYKTPYPIGSMGGAFLPPTPRVLASADFPGMVKWVKDFITTNDHGGARLAQMANGSILPYSLTASTAIQIPNTPIITSSGTAGFALNQLQFTSSAYASPNGQSFAAMQWRIGEIYDPSTSGFVAGQPWKYEISPLWTSAEISTFNANQSFPPDNLQAGRTYRARVRHKDALGRWSQWSEPVQFVATTPVLGDAEQNLVISEIHYHPRNEPALTVFDGDQYEFIELMNIHPTAQISTGNLAMLSGVTLLLPAELLNPGERVVIVRNLAAFQQKYGIGPRVIGVYAGGLSNDGESLVLGTGATALRTIPYQTGLPWPSLADGSSLVLIAPQTNPNHSLPQNWRPSAVIDGTPGAADTTTFSGSPTADADHDGLNALAEYALGTSDTDASSGIPQLTSTWVNGNISLSWQRNLAADDLDFIIESSADLNSWAAANATLDSAEQVGSVWKLQHHIEPPANGARFFVRIRFLER